MVEGNEVECFDPELAGIYVHGCSAYQIYKLKHFYMSKTGDLDLEKLEENTKGL